MKLKVLQNHETVLEPRNSIGILSEALSFSQLFFSGDVPFQYPFFGRQ
jgi:hypothetical protein